MQQKHHKQLFLQQNAFVVYMEKDDRLTTRIALHMCDSTAHLLRRPRALCPDRHRTLRRDLLSQKTAVHYGLLLLLDPAPLSCLRKQKCLRLFLSFLF